LKGLLQKVFFASFLCLALQADAVNTKHLLEIHSHGVLHHSAVHHIQCEHSAYSVCSITALCGTAVIKHIE